MCQGYFQAALVNPGCRAGPKANKLIPLITLPLPLIFSVDDTLKIVVPVTEGKLFRVGDLKVKAIRYFRNSDLVCWPQKG